MNSSSDPRSKSSEPELGSFTHMMFPAGMLRTPEASRPYPPIDMRKSSNCAIVRLVLMVMK